MCHLSDDPSDLIRPEDIVTRQPKVPIAFGGGPLLPRFVNVDYRLCLISLSGDQNGCWRATCADKNSVFYKSAAEPSFGHAFALAAAAVEQHRGTPA